METLFKVVFICLSVVVIGGVIAALFGVSSWLFQWAWNTFVVFVFHAPSINFIQALAGVVVISIVASMFSQVRVK